MFHQVIKKDNFYYKVFSELLGESFDTYCRSEVIDYCDSLRDILADYGIGVTTIKRRPLPRGLSKKYVSNLAESLNGPQFLSHQQLAIEKLQEILIDQLEKTLVAYQKNAINKDVFLNPPLQKLVKHLIAIFAVNCIVGIQGVSHIERVLHMVLSEPLISNTLHNLNSLLPTYNLTNKDSIREEIAELCPLLSRREASNGNLALYYAGNKLAEQSYQLDLQKFKKTSSPLKFLALKEEGLKPGIIVAKINNHTSTLDQDRLRKYLVKKDDLGSIIAEKIVSTVMIHFLGNQVVPKISLVHGKENNRLYVGSRYLPTFINNQSAIGIQVRFLPQNERQASSAAFNKKSLELPSGDQIMVLNLFCANYDIHAGNLGRVTMEEGSQRAAIVDFGEGLNFMVPSLFTVNSNYTLHGAGNLIQGEPFFPDDMIRAWHHGFYNIPSSYFLRQEFVRTLQEFLVRINGESLRFEEVVGKVIDEIKEACEEVKYSAKQLTGLKRIHPETGLDNLKDTCLQGFRTRVRMLEDLALQITLQISIHQGDQATYLRMKQADPKIEHHRFKWFTEKDDRAEIYPASTVDEFQQMLALRSRNTDRMDVEKSPKETISPRIRILEKRDLCPEVL